MVEETMIETEHRNQRLNTAGGNGTNDGKWDQ